MEIICKIYLSNYLVFTFYLNNCLLFALRSAAMGFPTGTAAHPGPN